MSALKISPSLQKLLTPLRLSLLGHPGEYARAHTHTHYWLNSVLLFNIQSTTWIMRVTGWQTGVNWQCCQSLVTVCDGWTERQAWSDNGVMVGQKDRHEQTMSMVWWLDRKTGTIRQWRHSQYVIVGQIGWQTDRHQQTKVLLTVCDGWTNRLTNRQAWTDWYHSQYYSSSRGKFYSGTALHWLHHCSPVYSKTAGSAPENRHQHWQISTQDHYIYI